MPTAYPGDPTATQAPSAQPGTGAVPTANIPIDGEAANAASVAQEIKVAMDFIAMLQEPYVQVGTGLALPIQRWKNAKLQPGFGIDHWGLPRGRFMWFEECWTDYAAPQESPALPPGSNGPWFGAWKFGLFGSAAQVYSNGADPGVSVAPWGPIAGAFVTGGTPTGSASVIELVKPLATLFTGVTTIEAAISINGTGAIQSSSSFCLGLGDGTLVSGASIDPTGSGGADPDGVFIGVQPTSDPTVWRVGCKNGGSGAGLNTAVPVVKDSPLLWQAVIVGADAADDSAAHVLHYINGVFQTDQAIAMTNVAVSPFIRTTSVGATPEGNGINVGRLRIIHRLELGTVW